jgi:hypothetical protein
VLPPSHCTPVRANVALDRSSRWATSSRPPTVSASRGRPSLPAVRLCALTGAWMVTGMLVDQDNHLVFGGLTTSAVYKWDTTKPLTPENQASAMPSWIFLP